ncbi:hypothetical protein OIE66_06370 [Nonomuraea sp. NBC_01738]|uniref:hypothetical protein n=1 Tax=Nonomuraea sp. NBC_01738 TaxID=2976003 RepID=UPI002E0F6DBD|nr:hypothetical protein OIE66_06370 [Nonomuraea sp. NBC_01738]
MTKQNDDKSTLGELSRVCLGVAVLLERQVRRGLGTRPGRVSEVTAVALGAADRTAAAARDALARGREAARDPGGTRAASWITRPARAAMSRVANRLDRLAAHGHAVADSVSGDAATFLKAESDRVMAWARINVIPPIVDDMAENDKIRKMVFTQVRGAVSDADRSVKGVASDADDRVEAGFRRLLRRSETVDDG